MQGDSGGTLVELTRQECLDLLGGCEVGRLAVVVEGQPVIFPVNYVLDGELVVFRNDPGTKLSYSNFNRVAFEVDDFDLAAREGWSVVVTGAGREFTDAMDSSSLRELELPLFPWTGSEKSHWVRIVAPIITGRRIIRNVAPS